MSDLAVRTVDLQAQESQAFALDALDAIARVKTPDEAENLLARVKVAAEAARVMHLGKALSREWRSIDIKAERKWGELLGEAEKGRPLGIVTDSNDSPAPAAERKAAHDARKLYAIPEPVFEDYMEQTATPTKAGLLRAARNVGALVEPKAPEASHPEMTQRQREVANATKGRIEKTLHTLDGMCMGLASIDATNASATATEEQISEWLATADRARSNLRRFTTLLSTAA